MTDSGDEGFAVILRKGRNNAERLNYEPSPVISVLAVAFFSIAFVLHFWQVLRYRTWWLPLMVIGVGMEAGGYITRMLMSYENLGSDFVVVDFFFIMVAPSFIFLTYYNLCVYLAKHLGWPSSIRSVSLIVLFPLQACNLIVIILLCIGLMLLGLVPLRGLFIASSKVLFGGLCIQCFCILIYCICYGRFWLRTRHLLRQSDKKLRRFVLSLGLSTILIFIRTLFRLAQVAESLYSGLSPNKTLFAIFEFAPMVVVVYLLAIWHPSRCIPTLDRPASAPNSA